ncbi:NAD dependent epimerase/dehydratase [Pseudomassariella vexata]|uniref:NAD dependent epimerase/dehydratase n=1 Tax=Pseudomassariella vexata TaxID=1141098 RepID=A0A1Y2DCJ7_9PEZI|nr:NAD dependent epimerase/dehydratase [Pseudomassariella vexata]ORY56990.1 NAD dependent epimerase/dehydratase [Pseudomassariella vexata]
MSPKRILLTGANGYLAQHILSQLLSAGHSVRGLVRTASKAAQLESTFSSSLAQLDVALVPDMTIPGAFDAVLQSDPPFDCVIHTASPFNYRKTAGSSNREKFLDPAIKGTTEVLEGIARVAPGVKRVVLTSSIAAVIDWTAPKITTPAKIYTGEDWNPVSLEDAETSKVINTAYQASKTYAEKAAWDFVNASGASQGAEKPGFDLVTLCPPMIYGPLYDPAEFGKPADLNQSTWVIYNGFLRPGLKSTDPVPEMGLHLYVDVRDIAKAHLLAAEIPDAGGKRFVICGGSLMGQRTADLLREKLPEKRGVIPEGTVGGSGVPEGLYRASSAEAEKVLGLRFRGAEETLGDLAGQLVEIEERGGQ